MKTFQVQYKRPRNRKERNTYPLEAMNKIGAYFVIPADRVPRGNLSGIGRRLGLKLSVMKQADGSVMVERVG